MKEYDLPPEAGKDEEPPARAWIDLSLVQPNCRLLTPRTVG